MDGNRDKRMPFRSFADPEQLQILSTALDNYCREFGIEPGTPEREDAAEFIIALFNSGAHTADELRAALDAPSRRNRRTS